MMKYLVLLLPLMTACTSYSKHNRQNYQMATVTQTQPVYRTIEIHKPRTVCEERQQVKRHADSAAPTIVGAIVGGVLGNTIARNSSNRGLGTAAGAVIGGAIGNDVGQKNGTDVMHHETVCYQSGTEVEYQSVIDGYQVTYQLNGREYTALMDRDPGPQMPVYVEPNHKR